jgi:pimeloyl-ACP methyl ester carboxylesterase
MTDVKVNGVRLSYNIYGDNGPPVLLVMGVGWRASVWQNVAVKPLLAAGYRVYTFDNRGTPPSEIPQGPYTIETFALDTIGLMEALELRECRIWGLSVGGLVCQEVTRCRPDLVKGAICHNGFGRHSAFGQLCARAMIDLMNTCDEIPESIALLLGLKDSLRPRAMHDDRAVEEALDFLHSMHNGWDQGFAWQLASTLEWAKRDHSDELASIRRPVLVLAAEHDASFPPSQVQRHAALVPQGRFVELADANHVPLYGVKTLVRTCVDFFDSLDAMLADSNLSEPTS